MKGIPVGALILALVSLQGSAPAAKAQQTNPAPVSQPAPGNAPAATSAPDPDRISVNILNRIPDVDRGNLKPYWPALESRTKERWMQILPSQAKPPLSTAGEVKIVAWIHTDGRVTNLALEQPSGTVALDRAAWAAITGSVPYDAFPYGISVNQVRVRFTFIYNEGRGGFPINGKRGLAGVKPRSLVE